MRGNDDLVALVWNDLMVSFQCELDRHISDDTWHFCEDLERAVVFTSTGVVETLIQGAVKEAGYGEARLNKFLRER
jgi:hypothetical protein